MITSVLLVKKTIKARMYVIYLLAYNTGMREGEIAGLTWDCLNVDKKEISVHQQVIRADGKYQIVSLKQKHLIGKSQYQTNLSASYWSYRKTIGS